MRQYKALSFVLVTLIALLLLPVQDASAQATFTPCEGVLIPLGIVDSGAWTYPGGNTHVRGMVSKYRQYMNDLRCSGLNTSFTNANWDAYGAGPLWGTFRMVLVEGSLDGWDGTWTGMRYADGSYSIHVEGHGQGALEGLLIFVDIEFPGLFLPGTATGYILDRRGE
jgi:hypothetical protein